MDLTGMHVFISGPMTGIESYNVHAFVQAHVMLKACGAENVYNPALSWLDEKGPARDHESYMMDSIAELASMRWCELRDKYVPYDLLVRLPGWERSDGARLESSVAEAIGIKVVDLAEVNGGI